MRAQPVDERGAPLARRDPQHQRGIAFDAALTPSDPQVVPLRGAAAARRASRRGCSTASSRPATRSSRAPTCPRARRGRCLDLPIAEIAAAEIGRRRAARRTIRRCWSTGGWRWPTRPPTTPRRRASRSRRRARSGRRVSSRCWGWRGWRTSWGRPTTSCRFAREARGRVPEHPAALALETRALLDAYRFAPRAPVAERLGAAAARRSRSRWRWSARARGLTGDAAGALAAADGLLVDRSRIRGGLLPARARARRARTPRRRGGRAGALRALPRVAGDRPRAARPLAPAQPRPRRRIRAVPHARRRAGSPAAGSPALTKRSTGRLAFSS